MLYLFKKQMTHFFKTGVLFLALYTSACTSKYDYQSEFIGGFAEVSKEGKYGFINEAGEEVIPLKYQDVSNFIGEYAKIKLNGKYGFINKNGEEVISPKYDKIYGFNGEYAKIIVDGKFGLLDKTIKEIIPPKYESVNYNIIGGYFEVIEAGQVKRLQKNEVVKNI